jgi:hypothetical protein
MRAPAHRALRETLDVACQIHNGNILARVLGAGGVAISAQLEEAFRSMDDSPGGSN